MSAGGSFPNQLAAAGNYARKLARHDGRPRHVYVANGETCVSPQDPGPRFLRWLVDSEGRVRKLTPEASEPREAAAG